MISLTRKPASEQRNLVNLPYPARRLREVDRLSVYRCEPGDGLVIPVPHRPVIACYDVPLQDRSGRWVWAVCLGAERVGAVVPSLALRRYCFTSEADRRYGWLYRDEEQSGDQVKMRIAELVGRMAEQLEQSVAATLGRSVLVYVVSEGRDCIELHEQKQVGNADRTLVLATEVVAAAL